VKLLKEFWNISYLWILNNFFRKRLNPDWFGIRQFTVLDISLTLGKLSMEFLAIKCGRKKIPWMNTKFINNFSSSQMINTIANSRMGIEVSWKPLIELLQVHHEKYLNGHKYLVTSFGHTHIKIYTISLIQKYTLFNYFLFLLFIKHVSVIKRRDQILVTTQEFLMGPIERYNLWRSFILLSHVYIFQQSIEKLTHVHYLWKSLNLCLSINIAKSFNTKKMLLDRLRTQPWLLIWWVSISLQILLSKHLLQEFISLLRQLKWRTSLSHIFREANICTNFLANWDILC
jgi:hypothetical protein